MQHLLGHLLRGLGSTVRCRHRLLGAECTIGPGHGHTGYQANEESSNADIRSDEDHCRKWMLKIVFAYQRMDRIKLLWGVLSGSLSKRVIWTTMVSIVATRDNSGVSLLRKKIEKSRINSTEKRSEGEKGGRKERKGEGQNDWTSAGYEGY